MKKAEQGYRRQRLSAPVLASAALIAGATLSFGDAAYAADAKAIVESVCGNCHGVDGNSAMPMFPKLAGLSEAYIVKQLNDFRAGRRTSDVMAPMAAQLKSDDIEPLAAYFSAQTRKADASSDVQAAEQGKQLFTAGDTEHGVPACIGCHQPLGAGKGAYPRIGGQHAEYVSAQLKNFAAGDRSNDRSKFMRTIAKHLSDDQVRTVAEYLAGLGEK